MVDNLKTSIANVIGSSLLAEVPQAIGDFLRQQTTESISECVSQSLESLVALERWSWHVLTQDSHLWAHQSSYLVLFDALASFNSLVIFNKSSIDVDTKVSLLLPETIACVDQLCERIANTEDANDAFFLLLGRWLDNLAYFIHEHTQIETLPVLLHLQRFVGRQCILSEQYKSYLTQLYEPSVSPSIFTAKHLFYLRTCSFLFRMFASSKLDKQPFQAEELLDRYGDDYAIIIIVQHRTVHEWSKDLLACMTHIVDFLCSCCWWGDEKPIHMKRIIASEQSFYDLIQALIHIVQHPAFHEQIQPQWSNDETILVDSVLIFFIGALLQVKNMSCFLRAETDLAQVLLTVAQKSSYDRISVCAYGILAEIMSDDQMKQVRVTDGIFAFFFGILEHAWKHPTQRYKRIPISQLLIGKSTELLLSKGNQCFSRISHAVKERLYSAEDSGYEQSLAPHRNDRSILHCLQYSVESLVQSGYSATTTW